MTELLSDRLALEIPQRLAVVEIEISRLQEEREKLLAAMPHLRPQGKARKSGTSRRGVRQASAKGRKVRKARTAKS